ncbi:bifunctional 5,10-methylenetetrahydrofolate dehydrogenase/5,10-methenyltetrahydrofolate cyclohydrolase [Candidatus Saccharibacteria bacterium]|nr:bifunctional 5,10-methylenetetrahydrofolate dehydrogenase/5,10-methenyltetrahydrofolate cyclohydrolase [Candidatus Saccharibacteria bacterium]
MKILNGKELAEFIKERQAHDARNLKQGHGLQPRLAIIRTNPDPVVDSYMKLKQGYGNDIGVVVDVHTLDQKDALAEIAKLNADDSVHGIIVQIPLPDKSQTTQILDAVSPAKDVDGLSAQTQFDPATPMAIMWLLAGYNVDLRGKNVVVVGHGRLVGKPLVAMLEKSDISVTVVDKNTPADAFAQTLSAADIIISATGVPGLITADTIKSDAVIVDAGVATDSNGLVGDVSPEVRDLPDITITPKQGGVGPLTVCALFENVLKSARQSVA